MPVALRKPKSISLPEPFAKEVERFAKREHQTVSELVRAALRHYMTDSQERRGAWKEVMAYGRKKAKEAGIHTEEEVYRIMDQLRHGRASRSSARSRSYASSRRR